MTAEEVDGVSVLLVIMCHRVMMMNRVLKVKENCYITILPNFIYLQPLAFDRYSQEIMIKMCVIKWSIWVKNKIFWSPYNYDFKN